MSVSSLFLHAVMSPSLLPLSRRMLGHAPAPSETTPATSACACRGHLTTRRDESPGGYALAGEAARGRSRTPLQTGALRLRRPWNLRVHTQPRIVTLSSSLAGREPRIQGLPRPRQRGHGVPVPEPSLSPPCEIVVSSMVSLLVFGFKSQVGVMGDIGVWKQRASTHAMPTRLGEREHEHLRGKAAGGITRGRFTRLDSNASAATSPRARQGMWRMIALVLGVSPCSLTPPKH